MSTPLGPNKLVAPPPIPPREDVLLTAPADPRNNPMAQSILAGLGARTAGEAAAVTAAIALSTQRDTREIQGSELMSEAVAHTLEQQQLIPAAIPVPVQGPRPRDLAVRSLDDDDNEIKVSADIPPKLTIAAPPVALVPRKPVSLSMLDEKFQKMLFGLEMRRKMRRFTPYFSPVGETCKLSDIFPLSFTWSAEADINDVAFIDTADEGSCPIDYRRGKMPHLPSYSPLTYAVSQGLDDLVEALIVLGADVHQKVQQFEFRYNQVTNFFEKHFVYECSALTYVFCNHETFKLYVSSPSPYDQDYSVFSQLRKRSPQLKKIRYLLETRGASYLDALPKIFLVPECHASEERILRLHLLLSKSRSSIIASKDGDCLTGKRWLHTKIRAEIYRELLPGDRAEVGDKFDDLLYIPNHHGIWKAISVKGIILDYISTKTFEDIVREKLQCSDFTLTRIMSVPASAPAGSVPLFAYPAALKKSYESDEKARAEAARQWGNKEPQQAEGEKQLAALQENKDLAEAMYVSAREAATAVESSNFSGPLSLPMERPLAPPLQFSLQRSSNVLPSQAGVVKKKKKK